MAATNVAGNMFSDGSLLITIRNRAGTQKTMHFHAMTKSVDISGGEKDIEQVPTVRGGRLVAQVPQTLYTVTFVGHQIDSCDPAGDSANMEGADQLFYDSGANWVTEVAGAFAKALTRNRERYQIALLWTTDSTCTSAVAATAAGSDSYRLIFNDAWMTACNPTYGDDNKLGLNFVFKVVAFNAAGQNLIQSSTATSTILTAPPSYPNTWP